MTSKAIIPRARLATAQVWRTRIRAEIDYINTHAGECLGARICSIISVGESEEACQEDVPKGSTQLNYRELRNSHRSFFRRMLGEDVQYRRYEVRREPLLVADGRVLGLYDVLVDAAGRINSKHAPPESKNRIVEIRQLKGLIWSMGRNGEPTSVRILRTAASCKLFRHQNRLTVERSDTTAASIRPRRITQLLVRMSALRRGG
jgi:hypothetical protein